MRILFVLLLGCLFACSSNSELSQKNARETWTSAGLSVDVSDAENLGTGIETVVSVGEFLFARNDRQIDGERRYQLFQGKIGSLLWKELELPDGDIPNVLFADSGILYVGTFSALAAQGCGCSTRKRKTGPDGIFPFWTNAIRYRIPLTG